MPHGDRFRGREQRTERVVHHDHDHQQRHDRPVTGYADDEDNSRHGPHRVASEHEPALVDAIDQRTTGRANGELGNHTDGHDQADCGGRMRHRQHEHRIRQQR